MRNGTAAAPLPAPPPPNPLPPAAPATVLRRRHSWTLFRYVAREYLVPLACCVAGFLTLFILADVFDVLQDFTEKRTPLPAVLLFFALRQPANLVHVLPMSVLLSASFMINVLGRHHEITALRAAGLSMVRCCLPVWIAAVAFSVLSLWLNERLGPQLYAQSQDLFNAVTNPHKYHSGTRAKLAYRNNDGNRDWFFESFSRDGEQRGVMVKQYRPDRRILWELTAARAVYEHRQWVFFDAARAEFDAQGALPAGPETRFARYVAPGLDESPHHILNTLKPAEELSTRELLGVLRNNPNLPASTQKVFRTTIWQRLTFPFSCVVAALLGVALSITREKSSALRGFAMAVALMVVYYLVCQTFVVLGKNGALPPLVAGVLPTALFAGWGAFEMHRRR